jgi:DNA replication protein DnaC
MALKQTQCKICLQSITIDCSGVETGDPVIDRVMAGLWQHVTCESCATQAIEESAQRRREERNQGRDLEWSSICPAIYQGTDENYPGFDKTAYSKAMAYEFKNGRGLVLAGESRSGKTRSAFSVVKREFMSGRSVKYLMASSFGLWNKDISRHGLKRWESEVKKPSILFIDDVGKAITGDGRGDYAESQFWAILETRFAHALPVLMTIQQSGEQMKERMSGEVGTAFIERIREFCDQIGFKKKGDL